jgi:hypothetical protein
MFAVSNPICCARSEPTQVILARMHPGNHCGVAVTKRSTNKQEE